MVRASPSGERTAHARRLFAGLPSRYDAMGRLWSFGQDPRWRRFLVSRLPATSGQRVLDVATGTAAVAIELLRRSPTSVVGVDQSEPMVRRGARRGADAGLTGRVAFVLGKAEPLAFS